MIGIGPPPAGLVRRQPLLAPASAVSFLTGERDARTPVLPREPVVLPLLMAWRVILASLGLHLLGLAPVAVRLAWRPLPQPAPVWAKIEFVEHQTPTVGQPGAERPAPAPASAAASPERAPASPPDRGKPVPSGLTQLAAASARASPHYDPAIRLGDDDQSGTGLVRGSAVIPARLDAKVQNRLPPYPREARLMLAQGEVVLLVHVAADGSVAAIDLEQSSGYEVLDRAGREAVQRWHFVPGTRDGLPVESETLVDLRFTLKGITR